MNRREEIQVKERMQKISKRTSDVFLLATIVAVYKEFGFDAENIEKLLKAIVKEAEIMSSGMIGFYDYQAYAEELTGFKLEE